MKDYRVTGNYTLPQDAELVTITPHTHLLAKWLEVRAWLPGKEKPQLVVRVPKWDYKLAVSLFTGKATVVPGGDTIRSRMFL